MIKGELVITEKEAPCNDEGLSKQQIYRAYCIVRDM